MENDSDFDFKYGDMEGFIDATEVLSKVTRNKILEQNTSLKVRGGEEHYPQLANLMTELEQRQVVSENWNTEGLVDVDLEYRRVVDNACIPISKTKT